MYIWHLCKVTLEQPREAALSELQSLLLAIALIFWQMNNVLASIMLLFIRRHRAMTSFDDRALVL
jgi:hypothetical protein